MSIQGFALSLRDSPHLCPKSIEHEGYCSVMSDSLWPHGLQHNRFPCPSLPPFTMLHCPSLSSLSRIVCSDSCPLSQWCHPTISPSVIPLFSYLQSFPASGSIPTSQLFTSGGQSIGVSALPSVLPMNIQGLISFRIDWFDLLAIQGTLKSLLQHHSSKASVPWCSAFFTAQLSHPYMTARKTIARWTFVSKIVFLFFNVLYRFVIALHPRNKFPFISWLQSLSTMILEPKKKRDEDAYYRFICLALISNANIM